MTTTAFPRVALILLSLTSSLAFPTFVNAATQEVDSTATVTVEYQLYANWVALDAVIEPTKSATVSAQTSGRILKLNYDVNDIVAENASLLDITSKEQGAKLAAAEAELAKANAQNVETQAQLRRYKKLFPQGAISEGAMDEAQANAKSTQQAVSAAKAGIVQATESLKYTAVSAPFSGVVTQRHVEQGETVSPGQPLYSGYSLTQMRAVTQVPQRYINALRLQPKFKLTLADDKQIISDKLNIFSFVDQVSHSYKVRIELPTAATPLIPGSLIKAEFVSGQRQTMFIPQSALITMNELNAVYLQQNNQWVLNQVRIGLQDGDSIEVLSGLSNGDIIAEDAYQTLLRLQKQSKP
ncbi:efflux RND transporter periplasmic adaptor subunit [Shewanella sp. KX20019]|uniref:efflux RND transporter periplasmic adaptor subunit n=1 Tax=Shewanella sp. KX20019 TaxID=2803864 RepID=UPI0019264D99|nr:efflux RND transporter periplasmic adaptor subunit [Shewanella sp. KX20019]QQX78781.1 efflux RND transporter periplasmic adaptor subunit [Shewanella sp. KX20019]